MRTSTKRYASPRAQWPSLRETPQIIDTLGWVYYKRGLSKSAIEQFQKAIQREPNSGFYHYHLGLAFMQAGDNVRGRTTLEQALKYGTNPATAAAIRRSLEGAPAAR